MKLTAVSLSALLLLMLPCVACAAGETPENPPQPVAPYTVTLLPPDPTLPPDVPRETAVITLTPRFGESAAAEPSAPAPAAAEPSVAAPAAAEPTAAPIAEADTVSPLRRFVDAYIVQICAGGAAVFFYLTRWRKKWQK